MNPFVSIFQPRRRRGSPSQTVPLPTATDSLSSSSDGSVPTPEDDPDLSARSSTRFANWLRSSSSSSSSKSSTSSLRPKPPPATAALSPPPQPPPQESSTPSDSDSDNDDDDDSDNYGEDDTTLTKVTPLSLPKPPPIPASSSVRASSRSPGRSARSPRPLPHPSHQNLRDITLSAINQRPPCPPFIHAPSGPVFPRSSNSSRLLPVVQTTRIVHHKTNVIRRLEAKSLTPVEHQSIAPFYNRSKDSHGVFSTRRRLDLEDVSALKDAKRVQDFSYGLQRWINRPCFEERCVAWHWDSDGKEIVHKQIQGSGKAVALLEFSEGLEAMSGFGSFPTAEPSRRLSAVPPVPRLDIQITGSSSPSPGPPTPKNAPPLTSARKTMRITPVALPPDDDEGDDVPLGIHFTKREEQGREDNKKKALAEGVIKARMRADAVRTGAADRENLHDRRQTYSRPTYDSYTSSLKPEPAKQDPHMLDTTRRPSSIRSNTTWNSDISKQWSSSAYLSPPTPPTFADLEGTKSQRRVSMLGSASDIGAPNVSSSQSRSSRVFTPPPPSPAIPVSPFPMVHTMPMYPFQLQPVMPVFMQPGFIAPPSPPSFNHYPLPSPPPIRAGLPVSRSAERLAPAPRSAYSSGRPSNSARRATAGPEDMQHMVEQMKRSGLHKELPGRSPLSKTTDSSRPNGQGREDRNQVQHKLATDPRSQNGRTDHAKRFSRMPSALSLPSKQPSTALYVSR